MNPEAISAMSALIDGLMSLGIPYYIGDSVASSAYGVVRSTLDADIIADLQLKHGRWPIFFTTSIILMKTPCAKPYKGDPVST
jgi:hypothetical protein